MARVLVVEDEPGTRRVLCESISSLGHEPDEARDGLEALERFRAGAYDVVVTDVAMPRMDGIELTRRLKAMEPGLAVLVVTGQASLDLMVRAVNRGISDYLRKPFSIRTFERTVERALHRRGEGAAAEAPPSRRGRTLGWIAMILAGVLLALVAWRALQQEAGLRELSRRMEQVERRAR